MTNSFQTSQENTGYTFRAKWSIYVYFIYGAIHPPRVHRDRYWWTSFEIKESEETETETGTYIETETETETYIETDTYIEIETYIESDTYIETEAYIEIYI